MEPSTTEPTWIWEVIAVAVFLAGTLSNKEFRREQRKLRKMIEKRLYKR